MADTLPILHVVYAGRGDSLYVEYQAADGERKLFAMDGGPRTKGENNTYPTYPYWRFFFSAGKKIWHEDMGRTQETFRLEAMVNSHQHSDHIEGLFDMLKKSFDFIDLRTGLIMPAMYEKKEGKKGTNHVLTLYQQVCEVKPYLRPDTDDLGWTRDAFDGGKFEYPPTSGLKQDGLETRTTIVCLKPPAERPLHAGLAVDYNTLKASLRPLPDFLKPYQKLRFHVNKKINDLNFASLLIHVPPTTGGLENGIYLTGDNNANIISYFMKKAFENADPDPDVNDQNLMNIENGGGEEEESDDNSDPDSDDDDDENNRRRHFSIYKIQHHGGRDDAQLTPPKNKRQAPMKVVEETALYMTLVAAANWDDPLLHPNSKWAAANEGYDGILHLKGEVEKICNRKKITLQWLIDRLSERFPRYKDRVIKGKKITYTQLNHPSEGKISPAEIWESLVKLVNGYDAENNTTRRNLFWMKKELTAAQKRQITAKKYASLSSAGKQQLKEEQKAKKKLKMETGGAAPNKQIGGLQQQPAWQADEVNANEEAVKLVGVRMNWWRMWWRGALDTGRDGVWFQFFDAYSRVNNIKAFFKSFTADAYVVSSNYQDQSHPHPHPETVCGLAYALHERNRVATLYITNPYSFKYKEFESLCITFGLNALGILRETLFVRYPIDKQVMSLTASPDMTGIARDPKTRALRRTTSNTYPQGLHDIFGDTRPLPADPLEQTYVKMVDDRNDALENNKSWKMVFESMATMYQISALHNNKTYYIQLSATGALEVVENVAVSLRVRESWESGNVNDAGVLWLSRTVASTDRRKIRVELVNKTEARYALQWMAVEGDDQTLSSVYVGNGGELEVMRVSQAGQAPAVAFKFAPILLVAPQALVSDNMLLASPFASMATVMAPIIVPSLASERKDIEATSTVVARISNGPNPRESDVDLDVDGQDENNLGTITEHGGTPPGTISTQASFDLFFEASRLAKEEVVTSRDALAAMVTDKNLESLNLFRAHEKQILGFRVDYDKSWINFTDDRIFVTATRAFLQLQIPENLTIRIGADETAIIDAKVFLEFGVENNLRVAMFVTTHEQSADLDEINQLRIIKILHEAAGTPQLGKILSGMGFSDDSIARMSMTEVLGVVLGSDEAAIDMVYDRVPAVLAMLHGFPQARPDWRGSKGKASYTATGQVYIEQARIECDLSGSSDGLRTAISLGPFSVTLKSLRIEIENARLAEEVVTLIGIVKFAAAGHDGVELKMSVILSSRTNDISTYFLVSGATSLNELTRVLGKSEEGLKDVSVPFSKAKDQQNDQRLEKLKLTAGTLGFVLRQPLSHTTDMFLDRLFFSTDLNGWREYLPSDFPSVFKNIEVQVDVVGPFEDRRRKVRVDVTFDLELRLKDESTRDVAVTLSAVPLVLKGDYEYRLEIETSNTGMSLSEISQAIGIEDAVSSVSQQVPLLDSAMNRLFVREISIGLVEEGGMWRFGDWSVQVWLPHLVLIPNVLSLGNVDLVIRNFGTVEVIAAAKILLPDPIKVIGVDLKTPTAISGGQLWLDIPGGVSAQNLLNAFHVGSLDDLPLIDQILRTELEFMSVTTSPSVKGRLVFIAGFRIKLHHPKIKIGPLEFIDTTLDFEISYPIDEVSDGDTAKEKRAEKSVFFSAYLLDGDLLASVRWESAENKLSATLMPTRTVTIRRLLEACVPKDFPGLAVIGPAVDDLELHGSRIDFATSKELALRHCDFYVAKRTTIAVEKLLLREVKLVYDVREANLPIKEGGALPNGDTQLVKTNEVRDQGPESPPVKKLYALAVVEKASVKARFEISAMTTTDGKTLSMGIYPAVENGLTIRGILALFDFEDKNVEFEQPEDLPPVFDVVIDRVEGELSRVDSDNESDPATPAKKRTKGLSLQSFHAVAHSKASITVIKEPAIEVLDIIFDVKYNAAAAAGTSKLSGILYGKLKIGKLMLELAYIRDQSTHEEVFLAEAALNEILARPYNAPVKLEGLNTIGLDTLASSTSMSAQQIELQEGMPRIIKPNSVGARVRLDPSKVVEVWATGDEIWKGHICGVEVQLQKLKAFFRYTQGEYEGQKRVDPTYEGYLRGRLNFKGLTTAEAQISIGPSRNATFMALLRSTEVGGFDVFEKVTEDIGEADGNAWKNVAPLFTWPKSIDQSQLFVFADFKSKKIILSAKIKKLGSALLLGQEVVADATTAPKKTNRVYIIFFEAENLNGLWAQTTEDVAKWFNIAKVAVQIIGYKTTLKRLREDISVVSNMETNGIPGQRAADQTPAITRAPKTTLELFDGMTETMVFEPGAWFVAAINLGTAKKSPMTKALALDAANANDANVRLYARVANDKPGKAEDQSDQQKTKYRIDIRSLQIFDGAITINGVGEYLPLPEKKEISLSAELLLCLSESDEDLLRFNVALVMDQTTTSFKVSHRSDRSITNPFDGRMFNVKLEGLIIEGSSTRKPEPSGGVERQCTISGAAVLGESGKMKLLGLIHFVNGKPLVAVVELNRTVDEGKSSVGDSGGVLLQTREQSGTIKMTDIFDRIVKPNNNTDQEANSWPADDFDDFELKDAYISYNTDLQSVRVGSRTYLPGFFVYGLFEIFDLPISVSLAIDKNRKGFVLNGSFADVLDLGIVKFTGHNDGREKIDGLTLSIDTRGPNGVKFGVMSGLTLFDKPNFEFSLSYTPAKSKEKREFIGHAWYSGTILGCTNPYLGFTYKNGQWSFSGWRIFRDAAWDSSKPQTSSEELESLVDNIQLDIDRAIELGSMADGGCGKLAKFVIGELVQMNFTFVLGLLPVKQKDMAERKNGASGVATSEKPGFKFTVKWSFSITVKGTSIGTDILLEEFTFVLPFDGFKPTVNGLLKYLWKSVLSDANLREIGLKLLKPKVLGKLLMVMALDKLADELIDKLVCRKPEGAENLKARSRKKHEEESEGKKEDLKKRKRDYDDMDGGDGPSMPDIPIIPIPLPSPNPVIPAPSPPRSRSSSRGRSPTTTEPRVRPGDIGLLALIKLYLEAVRKTNSISPEDLKSGLGFLIQNWDEEEGARVETRYKEVKALKAEVLESERKAKKRIQQRMNLRDGIGIVTRFRPMYEETEIEIDITSVLPLPKFVHEEDYSGIKWQVYLSLEDKDPTEDDKDRFISFSGAERKFICPNPEFRYAAVVYVWVRARVEESGTEFISNEWAGTTASHIPWLRPPRGLQIAMDGPSSVVVELPPAYEIAGDWDVAFVNPEKPGVESAIYRTNISIPDAGPGKFRVDIAAFGYNSTAFSKRLSARVKQKAWNTMIFHDSPVVDSLQSLPVISAPANLMAKMKEKEILLEWEATEALHETDYVIQLIREDTQQPLKYDVVVSPKTEGTVVSALLSSSEIVAGEVVSAIVGAKSTGGPQSVSLLAKASVQVIFPLGLIIGGDSSFDVPGKVLSLVVEAKRALSSRTAFQLQTIPTASGETAANPPFQDIWPTSVHGTQAVFRVPCLSSFTGSFVMRATDPTSGVVADTQPWDFPRVSANGLNINDINHSFSADGKILTVNWQQGQPEVEVLITLFSETTVFTALSRTVLSVDKTCSFGGGGEQGSLPESGTALVCFCLVKTKNATGQRERFEVRIP